MDVLILAICTGMFYLAVGKSIGLHNGDFDEAFFIAIFTTLLFPLAAPAIPFVITYLICKKVGLL